MSSTKDQVKNRIRELRELRDWVEADKKLKKDLVLIQLPYGFKNEAIMIPAMISKQAFEQIKLYDEKLKEEMQKFEEEQKAKQTAKENLSDVDDEPLKPSAQAE